MMIRRLVAAMALLCGASSAAFAQQPDAPVIITETRAVNDFGLSIRGFVMGTEQQFAAINTFEAVFGQAHEPFFGGGVQVIVGHRYFAEISGSRFRKTGQRAFRFNDQNFGLGLPLTAQITPFEVSGGYRFEMHPNQRFVPYGSAGVGSYRYKESSPSSDPGENLETQHRGFVLAGGVDVRLHRWVRVAVDEQYTHVPGILGTGGISKAANEDDLGGIAVRFRVVVGR